MKKYLPRFYWGFDFYGVIWLGFQIGYYTNWKSHAPMSMEDYLDLPDDES